MSRRCTPVAAVFVFILCLCWLIPAAHAVVLKDSRHDFRLEHPASWRDNSVAIKGDLARQLLAPGGDAAVEVYAARGDNPGLERIAATFEGAGTMPYLARRLSSKTVRAGAAQGLLRSYQGEHGGNTLEATVLYLYHQGTAYAVIGFGARGGAGAGEMRRIVQSFAVGPKPAPPAARGDGEGEGVAEARRWQWAHVADYGVWIRKPASWPARAWVEDGMLSLNIEAPPGEGGVLLWGGDLGQALSADQLAELWESNAGNMPNLARKIEPGRIRRSGSGIQGAPIQFREFAGVVDGVATRTYVGYVTHGSRGFVVMGVYPEGNAAAEERVRQGVLGLRLARPNDSQIASSGGIVKVPLKGGSAVAATSAPVTPKADKPPERKADKGAPKQAPLAITSATIKTLSTTPDMSLVLAGNLLYSDGIPDLDPEFAALRRFHHSAVAKLPAAMDTLGAQLDRLRGVSRAFDQTAWRGFLRVGAATEKEEALGLILVLEKDLLDRGVRYAAAESAQWVAIEATRKALAAARRDENNGPPGASPVRARLNARLIDQSLQLLNFYAQKLLAVAVPYARLHGLEANPNLALPPALLDSLQPIHADTDARGSEMTRGLMEAWSGAAGVLQVLDEAAQVNGEVGKLAAARAGEQARSYRGEAQRLARTGEDDLAQVLNGMADALDALRSAPALAARPPSEEAPLYARVLRELPDLSALLGIGSAHAGVWDSISKHAGNLWSGVKGTVHDAVNLPLEAYNKITRYGAQELMDIHYGVGSKRPADILRDLKAGFADIVGKVGTGRLGQDAMDTAQGGFKALDDVIGKGVVAQGLANAVTVGGYGLAKDLVTLNDGRADTLSKVQAAAGVALSFGPLQNLANNALSSVGGGILRGLKGAAGAAGRVMKGALNSLAEHGALQSLSHNAALLKSLIAGGGELGDAAMKKITGALLSNADDVARQLARVQGANKALLDAVGDGLRGTMGELAEGLVQGFKGEAGNVLGALRGALFDAYSKTGREFLSELGKGGFKGMLANLTRYGWQSVISEGMGNAMKAYIAEGWKQWFGAPATQVAAKPARKPTAADVPSAAQYLPRADELPAHKGWTNWSQHCQPHNDALQSGPKATYRSATCEYRRTHKELKKQEHISVTITTTDPGRSFRTWLNEMRQSDPQWARAWPKRQGPFTDGNKSRQVIERGQVFVNISCDIYGQVGAVAQVIMNKL